MTFKYNGSTIVPGDQGVDYETFKRKCTGKLRLRFLLSALPAARCEGERMGGNLGGLGLVLLLPRACPVLRDRVSSSTECNSLKSIVQRVLCLTLRLKALSALCSLFAQSFTASRL